MDNLQKSHKLKQTEPEQPEKKPRWLIFAKSEFFQVCCTTLGLVLLLLAVGLYLYGIKELDAQRLAKAMLGSLAITLLAEWFRVWWSGHAEILTWRWLACHAALWLALTIFLYWLLPKVNQYWEKTGNPSAGGTSNSMELAIGVLSTVLVVVTLVITKNATDARDEIREERKSFTEERRNLDAERMQLGMDRETLKNTMVEVKQSKQIMRLLPYLFEITRAIHDAENDAESQASLAHREDMYRLLRLCLQAREAMQVFPDDSTQTPEFLLSLLRRIENHREAPNVQKALGTDFPALRKELQQWAQSWLEELNQLRCQHNQQQTVWSAQKLEIWEAASKAARIVRDLYICKDVLNGMQCHMK